MNEILENSWHRWVDVRVKVVVGGGGFRCHEGQEGWKSAAAAVNLTWPLIRHVLLLFQYLFHEINGLVDYTAFVRILIGVEFEWAFSCSFVVVA